MKRCTKCKVVKPRSEFYAHGKAKGGVHSECKVCECAKQRALTAANPERAALINRRSKLKASYGLTLKQYQELLDTQNGTCAVCGTETPGGRGAFVVDHDHKTNRIRGLLCNACNVGLGCFKDDVTTILKAVRYLAGD
jgi:hypothetical protein